MGWLLRERRGPAWKQTWTEQTLSSMSLPPLPLLAIFGIIFLHFSASYYTSYKSSMQRLKIMTQFVLYLLVVPALLCVFVMFQNRLGRFVYSYPRTKWFWVHQATAVPLVLVAFVVALVVMLWYQTYFHCMWLPTILAGRYCY